LFQIEKGSLILKRPIESASSIELLIQFPFDWIFQYGIRIKPKNSYQLDDVETTMGKVAHKFVEVLFQNSGNNVEIARDLMRDYRALLNNVAEQYGVLLFLDEHRFDFERLKVKLESAMHNLLDIIEKNHLTILGLEKEFCCPLYLLGGQTVRGYLDLYLHDSQGKRVIFDLKWTRSEKKYLKKLKENKHVQLSVYKELLKEAENKEVSLVAYYILSQARLLSTKHLNGDAVHVITDVLPEESVIEMAKNSINYRYGQFNKGIIEEGEEMELIGLEYYNDTQQKLLLPLETENGDKFKKRNYYSAYNVFKGDII
jgi:hypothetical protein